MFKKEYAKAIIRDDDHAADYIAKKWDEIGENHDEVNRMIYSMEDQQAEWTDGVEAINTAAVNKIIKHGLDRKKYDFFGFDEFDIQDMYGLADGTLCRACAKGL